MFTPRLIAFVATAVLGVLCADASFGEGADRPLLTKWGEELDRNAVLPEYPRPQLVRESWANLNGEWDFALTSADAGQPESYVEKILVPFPVESVLSGVTRPVTPENAVWYRREFDASVHEAGRKENSRVLLHFGAVDWEAKVWVNGVEVGDHRGGFDAFSFDITDALTGDGPQELLVRVTDPTNRGTQPWGKQSLEPGGIVYTAVSGIWQTVWLEVAPPTRVASLELSPNVEGNELVVRVNVVGPDSAKSIVRVATNSEGGQPLRVTGRAGETLRLRIPDAHLWTPDDPYLYDLSIDVAVGPADSRVVVDRVESYFGMRGVKVGKAADGHERILLNGKEVFSFGPLDQGWWPDGLYTAPSDEALRWDIELTKRYGFNTCRKHVKVESARWYYWCDKLGLLVWQDMPNGGERGIGPSEEDMVRSESSEATYRHELKAMIDGLANHPSIIVWAPFNEGWGQFKTNEIIRWIQTYDPTRLVDGPSGWADRGEGDLLDEHNYPGPAMPAPQANRASVLGEFGGLGLEIPAHTWMESGVWGYRNYDSMAELSSNYQSLISNLWLLKRSGLAAAIYTQTTDVEGEVNGLVTYDRKVVKIDPALASVWNRQLYKPSPKMTTVLATSEDPSAMGQVWQYTTEEPVGGDWTSTDFDDSGWKTGRAGFGTPNTPGAAVRTEWETADIWLRRKVRIDDPRLLKDLYLQVHHDEDAEIYLDGQLVSTLPGFTVAYSVVAIPQEAKRLLKPGEHVVAVHCHQTRGGQYVDLGFLAVQEGDGDEEQPHPVVSNADADGVRKR